MLAEIGPSLTKTAEVDDTPQAGFPRGGRELQREVTIPVRILRACGSHGVNQVERCLASHEVSGKRSSVRQVGLADLDGRVCGPRPASEFPRRADQAANDVPVLDQPRRETASNVTGSPGNCDAFWI